MNAFIIILISLHIYLNLYTSKYTIDLIYLIIHNYFSQKWIFFSSKCILQYIGICTKLHSTCRMSSKKFHFKSESYSKLLIWVSKNMKHKKLSVKFNNKKDNKGQWRDDRGTCVLCKPFGLIHVIQCLKNGKLLHLINSAWYLKTQSFLWLFH